MSVDLDSASTTIASFSVKLALPSPVNPPLADVQSAIKQEYRVSVREKLLRCRAWEHLTERDDGSIYVLEVGRSVEFDWTWEGAIAYRPSLDADSAGDGITSRTIDEEDVYWCGEVVEVDGAKGRIFVSISNPDHRPTTGVFFVRPFQFLALLNDVYNGNAYDGLRALLPPRLAASEGNVHPQVKGSVSQGVPALQSMWERSWGVLWGPPGTGKTYLVGQQVAHCLDDPRERILVVSTTNKATDGAAIAIGQACSATGKPLEQIRRVGRGVDVKVLTENNLVDLITNTETDLLYQVSELRQEWRSATDSAIRAVLQARITKLTREIREASGHLFLAAETSVVVATAFKTSTMLWESDLVQMITRGMAPFTTVIIDESGLISRAAVAVLSLLAARRVLLVGDPKQLAPISRMSRILPPNQAHWLASSGISHLHDVQEADARPGIHLLTKQYRMHPEICDVVSAYQYGNRLETAQEVLRRPYSQPAILAPLPRATWYVLDEHDVESPLIRAERGPGQRSWIRKATRNVLQGLFADPKFQASDGLYISPFVAQAKDIASYFAQNGHVSWVASTVHSQQGAEADIVIFDTVNASSTSWPIQEWMRLVNVGLSRAREHVILLASRAEMQSPFLKPLLRLLKAKVVRASGQAAEWIDVPTLSVFTPPPAIATNPDTLGYQITQRQLMRPVLSREHERLCGYIIDGKPRLVRGVAGSGKTVVLAHWVRKTLDRLKDQPNAMIWVVFANLALSKLLHDMIDSAWSEEYEGIPFPSSRVELWHIMFLLDRLLPQVGLRLQNYDLDYDKAALAYLDRMNGRVITPLCHALFVDEGQDLGSNTLRLLCNQVQHGDPSDSKSRSIHFFYDNAQNIYGRKTPVWAEMGIDMRGRSTVMKESFRSTLPITELALNVLHRLCPEESSSSDHKELVKRHLVEKNERSGKTWWKVKYAQIDGPKPVFRKYPDEKDHYAAVGNQLIRWIRDEGVQPADICILYMNDSCARKLETLVGPRLAKIGVDLQVIVGGPFTRDARSVLITTPHSFKGYDSEIVLIPSVEGYRTRAGEPLVQVLYVAMTRARSLLSMFGICSAAKGKHEILETIEQCLDELEERPAVELASSNTDDFDDLLNLIGKDHKDWFKVIWASQRVKQEPMLSSAKSLLCEPLFWYESSGQRFACFPKDRPPSQRVMNLLEDEGVKILAPAAKG